MSAGAVLAALAAIAYETGYVLQARGARTTDSGSASPRLLAGLVRQPAWTAGAVCGVVGFALQVAALRHAPLALVQPILALGLLGLPALAIVVLGERPDMRDARGLVCVAVGAALVLAVAPDVRGQPAGAAPWVLATLAIVVVVPIAVRTRDGWALTAAVAAADVVVALAAARLGAADAFAAGWAALTVTMALASVTAEGAALQRLPAVRVGPVVLAAQAVVPVVLAPVVVGDRWPSGGQLAVLVAGLVTLAVGVAVLASSRRLAAVMGAAGSSPARPDAALARTSRRESAAARRR